MSTYMLTSSSLLYCNDIPCSFAEVSDHTGAVLNELKPVLESLKREKNDATAVFGSHTWISNYGKY